MKREFLKLTSLLLTILMVFLSSNALFVLQAAAKTHSGTCGDSLTWSLDLDSGVLTISGSGEMNNYIDAATVPWYDYKENVKSVSLSSGVTSIGYRAFWDCKSLKSITIPDSVTKVGDEAFYNCISLKSITIPDGVISIEDRAFYSCNSLNGITIPTSVTEISYSAFTDCGNLKSITVDENNPKYSSDEYGVLFNKDKTVLIRYPAGSSKTKYIIPDSVTEIGAGAFYYCDSLTSVIIPDSVTKIGAGAFNGAALYKNQTNRQGGVLYIGKHLIEAATDIHGDYTVKPDTLTIADWAFYGCSSLTSVTIPDSVTSIGDNAFSYCFSLKDISIPSSVAEIGNRAFYGCKSLPCITVDENNTKYSSDESGVLFDKEKTKLIQYPNANSQNGYIIPDSVTEISDSAFYSCINLNSVTIPDSVTVIGSEAFESCIKLNSITIGNSVTSIGYEAFYDCFSLKSIMIPDSVTSIGSSAFKSTALYNNESNRTDGVLYIGKHLIDAQKDIPGHLTIKSGTLTIADSAFFGCDSLSGVTIPDSVTSIGDMAFGFFYKDDSYAAEKISQFKIYCREGSAGEKYAKDNEFSYELINDEPESTTTETVTTETDSFERYSGTCGNNLIWGFQTFTGTLGIFGSGDMTDFNTTADIPWYTYKINRVDISSGVTSISDYAFYGCNLTSVIIPKSVKSIGDMAFGFFYNDDSHASEKISQFKIYCFKGSAGEKYAKDNEFSYEFINSEFEGGTNTSSNTDDNNKGISSTSLIIGIAVIVIIAAAIVVVALKKKKQ